MTLSVIVPTHKPHRRTKRALLELAGALHAKANGRGDVELLICVNGPGSRRIAEELRSDLGESAQETTKILVLEEAGVNRARNEAARQARGQAYLFLDDDTSLGGPLLEKISHYAHSQGQRWATGGAYVGVARTRAGRAYAHVQKAFQEGVESTGRRFFPGGFLLVAHDLFWELEGFDEKITWGGAELRLNDRLNRVGAAQARPRDWTLTHHIELGYRALVRKGLQQGRGSQRETSYDGTAGVTAPKPLRFGVALYRGAFLLGRSEKKEWSEFFMRFPGLLVLLCALSRSLGSGPFVIDLRKVDEGKFWRLCWILLRLRGLSKDRIDARLAIWHSRLNPVMHLFHALMDVMGKGRD